MKNERTGLFCVILAYALWGVLPLYWKSLHHVPAEIILTQRVLWSAVFLAAVLMFQGRLRTSLIDLKHRRTLRFRALSALFVCTNWLTYVWAMGHNHVLDAGLGYFVCPLFSVGLAAVVLSERLSASQKWGIAVVSCGVLMKVYFAGNIPWVALLLAGSWACYGTVRKVQQADPVSSLFQEVVILFPVIVLCLAFLNGAALFHSYDTFTNCLLVLSGPVTAVPILLLVHGLRTVPLRHTALVQFLTPTLNMVVAYFSGETFVHTDLYAFMVIWLGIGFYLGGERFLGAVTLRKKRLSIAKSSA